MKSQGPVAHEVVIVGAGFGGMGVAIQLQRMGIHDFIILERSDDVGGTWHLNRYPGLAVDIASPTYCYSFEPNPRWSQLYAPGAELKRYACDVAAKYGLRNHMRFSTTVEKAVYDEAANRWTVYLAGQPPVTCRFFVMATGYLSQPKRPDIAGLDTFAGKVIHTAEWDPAYALEGKRAAVIGTGATAVQLLPEIAPKLAHLYVYQRTPIWVGPKLNPQIARSVQKIFARFPSTQRATRYLSSAVLEVAMVTAVLHYREAPLLAKSAERACLDLMRRQIRDPELRRKLTPSYGFGCKRPTFSNEYYPTFTRPNVSLVTDPIECIEPDGIRTTAGKEQIDTLILATGYKVWEPGNFPAFPVYGRNGQELGEYWNRQNYESYEGITVHGYPNMFYLASPFSFSGLSYFFTIEGQMKHIERCLKAMRRKGAAVFEPSRAAQRRFVQRMQENMRSSVIASASCGGSNSYYFNQFGESRLLRPTPTAVALWSTSHFPLRDYEFS